MWLQVVIGKQGIELGRLQVDARTNTVLIILTTNEVRGLQARQ